MPPGLYSGTSSLSIGIGLYQSISGLGGGGAGSTPQLATAATFGNALWTTSTSINRFSGPWLFAPIEPGITSGIPKISNTYQSPVYDYRKDWYIKGLTHFASTTPLSGALAVQGGKRGVLSAFTVGGASTLRTQVMKQAQAVHVEGMDGDYSLNPTDQDGLFMGGAGGAKLTASISGVYMSVTNLSPLSYNSRTALLTGDILIGGTLVTGAAVPGTKVLDYGKVNCVGSITGTSLTTTSEVGAPIVPGISNTSGDFGMAVYVDGGVYVGVVTAVVSAWNGTSGSYTINNPNAISVAAGSRIFIESTGSRGSYLLDTSQTVTSTFIDFFPPTGGYYGVPADVPADRTAYVATSPGPIVTRQTIAVTGTHGTNLCKWVYGGKPGSGLNSATMTSLTMTGASTATMVLAGPIVATGGVSKGNWAKNTAYVVTDIVTDATTGRSYTCRVAHTSGNAGSTTFDTERQLGRWVAPNTAVAGWYPMGAWVGPGTAYLAGDVVTQGGALYFCTNAHTSSSAFATDASKWSNMANSGGQTGWTWKITATGNPAQANRVLPVGDFNRDWHVASAIVTGDGTNGTTILLNNDSTYTGNLPGSGTSANLATTYTYAGVVTPAQAIFAGAPLNGSKPLDGKEPGEHADSLGQMDGDKFDCFLGTDRIRANSSYQAGGITSGTGIQDSTEETSRTWWKWVLGLTPGEDVLCNIVWSGMQQVVVTKPKRYYQTWVDIGDRTWANWAVAPFPNVSLRPTATEAATGFSVANGFDATNNANYYAMGGVMYNGGHFQGIPPQDFAPASAVGFNATLGTYSNGRDPAASEMLALNFTNDTTDTLTTASSGTRIGWFNLSCSSNFPGVLADGSRCIVDPVPSGNYLGLGSAWYSSEAVRGRQAVPIGNNPTYVTCTVRGTAITKTFGPYNIIGAPAAVSTTLVAAAQLAPAPVTAVSVCTFAIGLGAVAADRDIFLALVFENASNRTISSVVIDGFTATQVTFSSITNSTQGTASEVYFYKARVTSANTSGNAVVTFNSSITACQVYAWSCTGVGVVYDAATATGAAANVGASVTVATPAGGAILAVHSYNSATSGANFRGTAMTYTGPGGTGTLANAAQTVSGTVTSTTNLDWNIGTEFGEQTIKAAQTGASLLSTIVLGPAVALDVNCISATLTNGNIAQAGTPTYVTSAGVVATAAAINTPRFDYNLGILRGLYVEPSRTNLLTFSQVFNGTGWVNGAVTFAVGATAPDSTASGTTATFSTSNFVTKTVTVTAAAAYTSSVYVKWVSGTVRVNLGCGKADSTDGGAATFDVASTGVTFVSGANTGTGTYLGYSITPIGSGWYRITCSAQSAGTSGGFIVTVNSPFGDLGMWGAQVEAGTSASSYIPTTTVAVTRAADTLNITSGIGVSGAGKTARCWHISGDFTDVTGVTVTAGAATLSAVSTKPIQGITFF